MRLAEEYRWFMHGNQTSLFPLSVWSQPYILIISINIRNRLAGDGKQFLKRSISSRGMTTPPIRGMFVPLKTQKISILLDITHLVCSLAEITFNSSNFTIWVFEICSMFKLKNWLDILESVAFWKLLLLLLLLFFSNSQNWRKLFLISNYCQRQNIEDRCMKPSSINSFVLLYLIFLHIKSPM